MRLTSSSPLSLLGFAGEYLGEMHGLYPCTKAAESATDVHQARVVPCRADLGLGVEDAPDLVREHRGGGVRVLDREGPAEPAALLGRGEIYEVDAPHVPQQIQRRISDLEHPQGMARRVVGHAVRVVGADVGDAELFHQKLGELEDPGAKLLDPFSETPVSCQVRGHRVELAHHAHAGARGCDDGLVTAEDLDEAPHEGYGFALVACVEVHLPAARLRVRKVYLHPEAFENLDGSPSRLGKERVVEAGYEERHSHRYIPLPGEMNLLALPAARDLLRDHELEYVGLEDHQYGHHDGQPDRPPQNQAQEVALLALEACGTRAYGEVLRADHLPQNATRGVGADGQVGAQPDLLGRDLLEVGEQGIRRGVRARERHP